MKTVFKIGMDEAGRGPWAGPVFCSACYIPAGTRLAGLTDSKQLSEKKREELFLKIQKKCIYGVGLASSMEIDKLGLIKATELGFLRAIKAFEEHFRLKLKLSNNNFHLLVDGRDKFKFPYSYESIIKGDEKVRSISAASILAKVTRDRFMKDLSLKFLNYGFERHKGYGTDIHMKALKKHGPCEVHRMSFAPIKLLSCNI